MLGELMAAMENGGRMFEKLIKGDVRILGRGVESCVEAGIEGAKSVAECCFLVGFTEA